MLSSLYIVTEMVRRVSVLCSCAIIENACKRLFENGCKHLFENACKHLFNGINYIPQNNIVLVDNGVAVEGEQGVATLCNDYFTSVARRIQYRHPLLEKLLS